MKLTLVLLSLSKQYQDCFHFSGNYSKLEPRCTSCAVCCVMDEWDKVQKWFSLSLHQTAEVDQD